jgi:hypothetical protein
LIFFIDKKSVIVWSSSLDTAEKTRGPPPETDDESLSRIDKSKVLADGRAPPTLRTRNATSSSSVVVSQHVDRIRSPDR